MLGLIRLDLIRNYWSHVVICVRRSPMSQWFFRHLVCALDIDKRIDEAREALSKRVSRLSRLIQEKQATPGPSANVDKKESSVQSYELYSHDTNKWIRINSILKTPTSVIRRKKVSIAEKYNRRIYFIRYPLEEIDERNAEGDSKRTNDELSPSLTIGSFVQVAYNAYNYIGSLIDAPSTATAIDGVKEGWYCNYCCRSATVNSSGRCMSCDYCTVTRAGAKQSNHARGWKCTFCNYDDNNPMDSKCSMCAQARYVPGNKYPMHGKNAGRSDRCADMYTGHNNYHLGNNTGKFRTTKHGHHPRSAL